MDAAAAIASGRPVCRRCCIIRSRSGCSPSSSSAAALHHRSRCPAVMVAPLRAAPSSQFRGASSKAQGVRLLTSRSQPPAVKATRKGRNNACSAAARVGGDLAGGGLEKAPTRGDRLPADNVRDAKILTHTSSINSTSNVAARHPALVPTAPPPLSTTSSSRTEGSKSTNITWHECPVGRPERQALLGQKGCVVWITGLSGSGKSTVACALARDLHNRGYLTYVLDGDNLRHGLTRDLGFSADDRAENIRRVGEVARLFADAGVICIASLISPYRKDRDACRAMVPEGGFVEVYMDAPLEVCEARDPKGLYKLARAGKIKGFTGIDDPYEPPLSCEITLRQGGAGDGAAARCPSPTDLAEQVVAYLQGNGYLRAE